MEDIEGPAKDVPADVAEPAEEAEAEGEVHVQFGARHSDEHGSLAGEHCRLLRRKLRRQLPKKLPAMKCLRKKPRMQGRNGIHKDDSDSGSVGLGLLVICS